MRLLEPRTLEAWRMEHFQGWWCKQPGYSFHTDPVDGCPGPHVPLYSWPANAGDAVELLAQVADQHDMSTTPEVYDLLARVRSYGPGAV